MSHIVIKIYSFECDEPECEVVEEVGDPWQTDGKIKAAAEKTLRKQGWQVRNGQHFCPEHGGQL